MSRVNFIFADYNPNLFLCVFADFAFFALNIFLSFNCNAGRNTTVSGVSGHTDGNTTHKKASQRAQLCFATGQRLSSVRTQFGRDTELQSVFVRRLS